MNSVYVRLYNVEKGEYREVFMDKRLSWKENLSYLSELLEDESWKQKEICDLRKAIFLDRDVPLSRFGNVSSRIFTLF